MYEDADSSTTGDLFSTIDKDGDGVISRAEYAEYQANSRSALTKSKAYSPEQQNSALREELRRRALQMKDLEDRLGSSISSDRGH